MKSLILVLSLMLTSLQVLASAAEHEFKFIFKSATSTSFEIKKQGSNKDIAFKLAAKECFKKLTQGKYPGEERGLDIIDICANPKM